MILFASESHIFISYMRKFNMYWIYHSYCSQTHYYAVCIICIIYESSNLEPSYKRQKFFFQIHRTTSASLRFWEGSLPISNVIELKIYGLPLYVLEFGLREYCSFFDGMSRPTNIFFHFSKKIYLFKLSYKLFGHCHSNLLQDLSWVLLTWLSVEKLTF